MPPRAPLGRKLFPENEKVGQVNKVCPGECNIQTGLRCPSCARVVRIARRRHTKAGSAKSTWRCSRTVCWFSWRGSWTRMEGASGHGWLVGLKSVNIRAVWTRSWPRLWAGGKASDTAFSTFGARCTRCRNQDLLGWPVGIRIYFGVSSSNLVVGTQTP